MIQKVQKVTTSGQKIEQKVHDVATNNQEWYKKYRMWHQAVKKWFKRYRKWQQVAKKWLKNAGGCKKQPRNGSKRETGNSKKRLRNCSKSTESVNKRPRSSQEMFEKVQEVIKQSRNGSKSKRDIPTFSGFADRRSYYWKRCGPLDTVTDTGCRSSRSLQPFKDAYLSDILYNKTWNKIQPILLLLNEQKKMHVIYLLLIHSFYKKHLDASVKERPQTLLVPSEEICKQVLCNKHI